MIYVERDRDRANTLLYTVVVSLSLYRLVGWSKDGQRTCKHFEDRVEFETFGG